MPAPVSSEVAAAAAVAERVRRRNRELALEAAAAAGMGVGFTVLTFAGLFGIVWMTWWLGGSPFGWSPALAGAVVVGVFGLLTLLLTWRRYEPFRDLESMSGERLGAVLVAPTELSVLMAPRHIGAGGAAVLLGGPANVLEAIDLWRHRLPDDDALHARCAAMLEACVRGVRISTIEDGAAAVQLKRLALVKVRGVDDDHVLELTARGEETRAGRPRPS